MPAERRPIRLPAAPAGHRRAGPRPAATGAGKSAASPPPRRGHQAGLALLGRVAERLAPAAPAPQPVEPAAPLREPEQAPVAAAETEAAEAPAPAELEAPASTAAEEAPAAGTDTGSGGTGAAAQPQSGPEAAAAAPAAAQATPATAPPEEEAEEAPPGPVRAAAVDPRQAVAPVAAAVAERAAAARSHPSPEKSVAGAQAAAIDPATEQARGAAALTVQAVDGSETGKVDKSSFKERLRKALLAAVPNPKNEEEAEQLKEGGAASASGAIQGELDAQTRAAAGGLESAAAAEVPPGAVPAPPASELVPEPPGPPPEPIAADGAVPPPLSPGQPDYSNERVATDRLMADNGISEQQLACGNEPEFSAVLGARQEAGQREAEMPGRYRSAEGGILAEQHAAAGATLEGGLGSIYAVRSAELAGVGAGQVATRDASAAARAKVTADIEKIKQTTVDEVAKILAAMDQNANAMFDAGLANAEAAYEEVFDEAKGDWVDWLTEWGDTWEARVAAAFKTARAAYDRIVSAAIDNVADFVERMLALAKKRVQQGREQVEAYVAGLDESLRGLGEKEKARTATGFDALEGEIDKHSEATIGALVDKYSQSLTRLAAVEEELREENKSVWDKIYDATVGIVDKILAFKDFLLSVLAKAAAVVEAIIADPIGFLGKLIDGISLGLDNFMANIEEHLKQGLLGWLFGALEGAGLKLPETFDLKGIIDLVLQVLGLTWDNIRKRLVRVLGEETVAHLEKASEIFMVLVREGPAGLWQMLVEKLGDIKETVLGAIREWVSEKIITAGIKWLLSLLNPVAAFIKACMAIYDIVKFFIERGKQIMDLINAIIDSMAALASGNISAMAKGVEGALAKIIPIAIGFLASLLGLGGISEKIKAVIAALQKPVNKAIDWVIDKAVALGKRAIAAVTGASKKDGQNDPGAAAEAEPDQPDIRTPEQKQQDLDAGLAEADALLVDEENSLEWVRSELPRIQAEYRFKKLEVEVVSDDFEEGVQKLRIAGEINPKAEKYEYRTLRELVAALGPINGKLANHVVTIISGPLKGEAVTYSSLGFPDFSPYAIASVKISMNGNRSYRVPDGDFGNANEAAGYDRNRGEPKGYTWHHHEDRKTMQLVETRIHDEFRHSGGVWVIKHLGKR